MQRCLICAENILFHSIAVLSIILFQSLFMDDYLYIVTLTKKLSTVSKKQNTLLCSLVLLPIIAHIQMILSL